MGSNPGNFKPEYLRETKVNRRRDMHRSTSKSKEYKDGGVEVFIFGIWSPRG